MARKKQKYYLVLSKSKNYRHGVFPYTPEGKEQAEKFIKHSKNEELYLVEK